MSNPQEPEKKPADDSADDEGVRPATPEGGTTAPTGDVGTDPQATVKLTPEMRDRLVEESYPSDPDDPLVGTLLRNKWRVLGRIGSGSFGTVYKVKDVNGEWIEALKILSVDRLRGPDAEAMRARFLREAQIMKRLGTRSPHIVGLSTYEDDIESGLIYFLMEHVEGRVLSEVLLEEGPLDIGRAVRIGLQVCDAMIAAHESEEPVVHRDLKLENIMMTTDRDGEESIKVLDFGIAKIAEREGDSRLTAAGTLGTPGYAAPEQLRAGDVDGRTDLFAFGVILYSLVTGRNPWLGHRAYQATNQTYELMAASDQAKVMPIADTGVDVPQGMVDIIMKLLQRDPADRFQSARELRDALRALAGIPRPSLTKELNAPSGTRSAPERRLAAVWFADLVGYSTLSSQDEEAALALLDTFHKTARREVEAGGGRIVQFIGDAAFAEFSSTQRAVKTAVDFMEAFTKDTAGSAFTPQLRIGVHVGDVLMAADGDLFGDGVNVAARIQNEADPGQILVSQDVWRQLKQRRDFGFASVGERSLKGIGAPVSLFAVVEAGEVATTGELTGLPTTGLPTYDGATPAGVGKGAKIAAGLVIALTAVGVGGYAVMNMGGGEDPSAGGASPAPIEATGTPATPPVEPTTVAGGDDPPDEDPQTDPGQTATGDPPPDPVEAVEPPPRDPVDATPVTTPPPAEVDPSRDPYLALERTVRSDRTRARGQTHDVLLPRLQEAESLWSAALTAAEAEEYAGALRDMGGAEALFREVINSDAVLDQIDNARAAFAPLRDSANDATLAARAQGHEDDADAAVARGDYSGALSLVGQAARAWRAAADAVPEPEVVPAEVVAEVLARLDAAMESKDIARVRSVWTSMTPEYERGLTATFERRNEILVTYVVQRIDGSGDRFSATVETTLEVDGFPQSQIEIFEFGQSNGAWVIVGSRVQG